MKKLFVLREGDKCSLPVSLLNMALVTGAVVALMWVSLYMAGIRMDFSFLGDYKIWILKGFGYTVAVSAASLILSLILGVLCAVGESSRIIPLNYLCRGYVTIIRGTPLIMQIYLFYYVIGTAWGIDNRMISGILILSVFEGAYISEIIRGSFLSIDETQLEAARAVGFNRTQQLRFVIIPQMVARTVPSLAGQFATNIKDSSLLSIISLIELSHTFKQISTTTFRMFESYIVLGLIYLCLTLPIMFVSKKLEKRFYYEN